MKKKTKLIFQIALLFGIFVLLIYLWMFNWRNPEHTQMMMLQEFWDVYLAIFAGVLGFIGLEISDDEE